MTRREWRCRFVGVLVALLLPIAAAWGHGSVVSPQSRAHRVFAANPENPSFELAENAIAIDGTQSYYTWMELSRNIPAAVNAGLPAGFDYSPWTPDGQLASGGRVDPASAEYPRTYAGLDQVSGDWPTTPATAGDALTVDFHATTPHEPSVWDAWLTTADWNPSLPLNWAQLEFLGRPVPTLSGEHYHFDVMIPEDRSGHHVLWIAWQRDDPVGEVFFSTSDLMIAATEPALAGDFNGDDSVDAADYVTWREGLGTRYLPADYNMWRAHFGEAVGSGAQSVGIVPEPTALVMLLCGALTARLRQRAARP